MRAESRKGENRPNRRLRSQEGEIRTPRPPSHAPYLNAGKARSSAEYGFAFGVFLYVTPTLALLAHITKRTNFRVFLVIGLRHARQPLGLHWPLPHGLSRKAACAWFQPTRPPPFFFATQRESRRRRSFRWGAGASSGSTSSSAVASRSSRRRLCSAGAGGGITMAVEPDNPTFVLTVLGDLHLDPA